MWIRVLFRAFLYPVKALFFVLIYIYKICISPFLPKTCGFLPTCSSYMLSAITIWGLRGIGIGLRRIGRCRPGTKGGYDFVPDNIKGELKWIY